MREEASTEMSTWGWKQGVVDVGACGVERAGWIGWVVRWCGVS
jgi:hypothetical protein